ncbi:MFS transporter [Streptococcus dysgalactiae]|uniref:MFS transporter n=1 Tax=Streptococcus dysgalactiae TaxID=1334 RepID=A0AAE9UML3_STRDY|nr:MFS transporter [Streptococcus dysgalactiae]WAI93392.1 MFS transporter [Streptococcus dysgalactiae]WCE85125.1 MFS transporter [Streptococcus dysgalactiae]WCN25125.1 MFS transporter [Streptococcus dysgalactiae]BBE39534.1 major Facilitator Superfamily protein [Streptococcus dysgalactiae]
MVSQKSLIEKISLLSLSLMMVSPFAVSPALPKMIAYYQAQGYQAQSVEILFSLSSFAILGVLLIMPFLNRFLSERTTVVVGLLLLTGGGSFPVLNQAYPLVFGSRILLGLGIGLINARAINIISERFSGKERITMLGYRGSAEVLGSAFLTFLAGYLIPFGWSLAYLIYGFGFVILALYLLFVPPMISPQAPVASQERQNLSLKQLWQILGLAGYAGFVILVNTSNTLRIPQVIDQGQLGSATQASLILSLMMLMGILAGISFGPLLMLLKDRLMAWVAFVLGLGMLVLWQGDNLFLVAIGALSTGFVYSIGVTYVFHALSERIPSHQLTSATTLVLIGCNLGGGGAALVLQLLSHLSSDLKAAYLIFALASLGLAIGLAGYIWFFKKLNKTT